MDAQEARDTLQHIISKAMEFYGLDIRLSEALRGTDFGGSFDGKNVLINPEFLDRDPEYTLYATIHGGLGHSYQIAMMLEAIALLYSQHHSSDTDNLNGRISRIQELEAQATQIGEQMMRRLLPDSPFLERIESFCHDWFWQDWVQVEQFFKSGKIPVFGQRIALTENPAPLSSLSPAMEIDPNFSSQGVILQTPIHFHVQAPALQPSNDNAPAPPRAIRANQL